MSCRLRESSTARLRATPAGATSPSHQRLRGSTRRESREPVFTGSVRFCRLAWNHPLPDGNKRAAWASLVMFVELNEGIWDPDPPNVDEAEQAMLAIAAGEVDEGWTAEWLRQRVRF